MSRGVNVTGGYEGQDVFSGLSGAEGIGRRYEGMVLVELQPENKSIQEGFCEDWDY